jgi:hypothetical protein
MLARRLMPRFPCRWPVEVQGPRGERFFAQASEISGGGIGIVVDHVAAVHLAPGGSLLSPAAPIVAVLVHPSGKEDPGSDLRLDGQVRHIRRLSQQQYLIGVHFVDPDAARRLVQRATASGAGRSPRLAAVPLRGDA